MNFIVVFSLYVSLIFPIILSLFGLEWVSSEESPLYSLTVIGCNAVIILYIIRYEILYHKQARGNIIPYFIPLIVFLLYLTEDAFSSIPLGSESIKNLQYFIAFSSGSIFSATYCCRYNKLPLIFKNYELLMLICSIAMIVAIPKLLSSSDTVVRIGGGNHQAISYSAALAFGGIYCSLYRNLNFPRYKVFKLRAYPVVAITILILLIIVCFIGGGRGGAVLLIVNFITCTYIIAKKQFLKIILGIFAALGIVAVLSEFNSNELDSLINHGMERSFAFIDSKGNIDLQNGSSGRDNVYRKAIELIEEKPVFGYGLFRQYELCERYIGQPYSHNIFLEVTLQYGFIGILSFSIILIIVLFNIYKLITKGGLIFLLPMTTFPLIMLQFSGTYLFNASFWFVFIIALGYQKWILPKK